MTLLIKFSKQLNLDFQMVRRFLDRKILFRSLGLAAVGSAGVIAHQEYSTFNEDFSYSFSAVDSGTNGANRKLSTPTRLGLNLYYSNRYSKIIKLVLKLKVSSQFYQI